LHHIIYYLCFWSLETNEYETVEVNNDANQSLEETVGKSMLQ